MRLEILSLLVFSSSKSIIQRVIRCHSFVLLHFESRVFWRLFVMSVSLVLTRPIQCSNMSDSHRHCLELLCRLCGKERAIPDDRNPICKARLSQLIMASFGIDVEDDNPDVHPPFICKACDVRLKRWWATSKKRGKGKSPCAIQVAVFDGSSCLKCRTATSPATLTIQEMKNDGERCGLLVWEGADWLQFMKMSRQGRPVLYLRIFRDLTWQLEVSGVLAVHAEVCPDVPSTLDKEGLSTLLQKITSTQVCGGNADFQDLIQLFSVEGQVPTSITPQDILSEGTIRHKKCRLLCGKLRCSVCQIYRSELLKVQSRQRVRLTQAVSVSSSVPNKTLTPIQLREKVAVLQMERRALKRQANTLRDRVADFISKESVILDQAQDAPLREIILGSGKEVSDVLGEDTPAGLLWAQQKEAAVKGKQMRWHPAIIRWCIALHSKSSSGYNILRQTGFMKLPHPSTLYAYTHFAEPTTGFNAAMLQRIVDETKCCPEHERNVSMLFDEMKVKSGLCFSVRSGRVVGFIDVTSIANEVADFERRCRGEGDPEIATHVLVLMLRGIFSSLHAPVGYYPTTGVTSDQLYACLYEAILYVETAGFKVRALVSDGASPNRKFYRIHADKCSQSNPTYSTTNPFDPSRDIYFVCDVPHLIKTTRNNWENSGWHNKTKNLFFNKQEVTWPQLLHLYELDTGLDRCSPGLRRLHKISYEHLHLTPALRMRVYMAAQVLSSTVANAFQCHGKVGTASTVKFVTMFDQFFDCLNVSNTYKGVHSRKPALEPYKTVDDWRFDWLKEDFLGFLREWEEEVQSKQQLDKATKKKMTLSRETVEGIKITVHSFVELGKHLLKQPGVQYLLSEKFCQDPLEEYFSKQRGAGGSNENPSVEQFGHNMLALHVAQGCVKASRRGNCRLRDREDSSSIMDSTPLPRRK
ncbi:uncharacterized protein LOC110988468 [Acanthaster planci]|uniref:Uncharacterized protein LOC110988468 n=1 Tax=Acanthaster planci TaxID=133434 RepID=A0A8B7ZS27_ACAPL|nr:uncharacterized protein LOC110988468 [Acanthaster planci]